LVLHTENYSVFTTISYNKYHCNNNSSPEPILVPLGTLAIVCGIKYVTTCLIDLLSLFPERLQALDPLPAASFGYLLRRNLTEELVEYRSPFLPDWGRRIALLLPDDLSFCDRFAFLRPNSRDSPKPRMRAMSPSSSFLLSLASFPGFGFALTR